MTHAYTIRLHLKQRKLFKNLELVTHISQLDEARLSRLGPSSVHKPEKVPALDIFFFFLFSFFFFRRWLKCKSSEKDTRPIVHGSVHGNGDREREREKEREQRMEEWSRKKSLARKVTKGTYKFWLFFSARGRGEVEGIWTGLEVYVGLSTATTAAGLTLLCYVCLRTSKYSFLQYDSRVCPVCNSLVDFYVHASNNSQRANLIREIWHTRDVKLI